MAGPRVFQRIPFSIQVEYRTAGAFLVAYSANLSKGGMYLETASTVSVGSDIALRFEVPGAESVDVTAVVAWVRPAEPGGAPGGMGVRFDQAGDDRFGEIVDGIVASFRGLRLLVVAADPQARSLWSRAVRSVLAAAEVIEAAGSADAAKVMKREPDLAVIDLDDDDGDAMQVLRSTRSAAARGLPVIALSHDEGVRREARAIGADEVLATAVANAELPQAVLRVIGKPTKIGT